MFPLAGLGAHGISIYLCWHCSEAIVHVITCNIPSVICDVYYALLDPVFRSSLIQCVVLWSWSTDTDVFVSRSKPSFTSPWLCIHAFVNPSCRSIYSCSVSLKGSDSIIYSLGHMLQQSPSSACSPTSYTRTSSHAHKQTHTHTNCLCLHWVVLLCVQAQPCHSILFSPSFDSLSPFLLSSPHEGVLITSGGLCSALSLP